MNEDTDVANSSTFPTPEPPSESSEVDEFAPIDLRFELEEALVNLDLSDGLAPLSVDDSGRFEIHELLGRGAMGAVYRAHDTKLDRDVALKVVQLAAPDQAHLQDRLLQEARALSRLSHPNVVHVFDIKEARSGERVIALEYIDGPTVRKWQRGRSVDEILGAYIEIAHGLAEAHGAGVVHRDFKPDNALVRSGEPPRVIVVDFGLAGGVIDDERVAEGLLSPIESTGLGTPEYMAPEQHWQPVTELCDQYAFCVSLWEAIDGSRPFKTRRSPADELSLAPARMPAWLYRILRKGLAWEPRERFPNMATLIRWLEYGRNFRRGLRWVAAATLVLASVGAVIWALEPPPCADAGKPIDEVWNEFVRAELERNVRKINAPWAARAGEHALETLDAVARTWSDEAHAVCEAEQASGRSADLDRRRGCLERWLNQFRSSVDLLRGGDPSAAEHLVNLLGPLAASEELCRVPPPSIDSRVRAKLIEAESNEVTRRFESALVHARAAVELASTAPRCIEGGKHSFEAAAANFRLGHVLGKLERWEESQVALALASTHALSCGDSWMAFEIRVFQSFANIRTSSSNLALATARLADAEALLEPITGDEGPSAKQAEALRMRGLVLSAAAEPRYDEAIDALTQAAAMLDDVEAPLAQRVRVRQNLGWAHQKVESYAGAKAAYADAKRLLSEALGDQHPETTRAEALVEVNEGLIALEHGEYDRADELFGRAAEHGDVVVVSKAYAGWVQSRVRAGESSSSGPLLRRYQRWLARHPNLPDSLRAESLYVMGQMLTQASLRDGGGVERPADFEAGLAWLREAAQLWAEDERDKSLIVRVIIVSSLYEAMRHDEAERMLDDLPLDDLPESLKNNVVELRDLIADAGER